MITKTKHLFFITAIVSFMMLIYMDQNGIGVTLPPIQKTFAMSNSALQWVMNSMLIATAVSVLIAGKLGDMFGTRRIFNVGLIGFTLASIICGIAATSRWMFIGRALQGVRASFMLTNYIVLIHHQYPKERWPKVVGLCVSLSAVIGAASPSIAGVLTEWLSWRGFFLINIPVALFCLVLSLRYIDKTPGQASTENIDYKGMAILVVAIAAVVSAVTEAAQFGWGNTGIIISLLVSASLFILFYCFEKKHNNPLLHFALLKNPVILRSNIIIYGLQTSLICSVYYALWMQHVLGFSPFITGLAYLPQTIPVIFMATAAGHWASKSGFRIPIVFGLSLASVSLIALTLAFLTQHYWWVMPFLFLWATGVACTYPTAISGMLSNVNATDKGMVVGLNQTTRSLASAVGLALFSTILSGIYGNHPFVSSLASKTAYTHAFAYAMLLPIVLSLIAWGAALKIRHT